MAAMVIDWFWSQIMDNRLWVDQPPRAAIG
jgi:hypothetical protein